MEHDELETSLNSTYNDEWLEASIKCSGKSDPTFIPVDDLEPLRLTVPKSCMPLDGYTYLVFEKNLEELMKFCMTCGSPISSIDRKSHQGTQVTYFFYMPVRM